MADGPYRHFSAGAGQQQQQHYYYQQNHAGPPRHITRTGSPVGGGGRNLFNNDTPSPSRSPVGGGPAHPFTMFNQGQAAQNGMMNGGNGGQRYMGMGMGHKYQQQQAHQPQHPHNHHLQQQPHGGHPGHNDMGHHYTFSGGIGGGHAFNGAPNGALPEEQHDVGEQFAEHWVEQLRQSAEWRQPGQLPHRHSRKGGAALAQKAGPPPSADESGRQWEGVERHRPTVSDDPRQDWDGLDMSGQGLRNLATCLFHNYAFLTKLFVDGNKLVELPPAVSSLRNLTHLQASGNQLRELPGTIGMLSKLEQLLVFDNQIRALPVELGYLYNLKMLGIEGNPLEEGTREFLVQHGTQALVAHLRDTTDPGEPPASREFIPIDESEAAETFSVMDYNILCNKYATRLQYKYTPPRALEWEYRRDLILNEIQALDADIVCLQEVDQENYHEFFRRELAPHDYRGIFWPKSRARTMTEPQARLVDGCAIFYKDRKFICLDKQLVDFGNTAINRPDMKGEHDIFNRVMPRDHVAVVAFFENRATGSRVVVANAHMYWDPQFDDVKLVQAAILMDQIERLADKWARASPCTNKATYRHAESDNPDGSPAVPDGPVPESAPSRSYSSGTQIPLVVCGDFNSAPSSGVYQFLATGSVPPDHPDLSQRSYGSFTRDGITHPFKLRSAYARSADDVLNGGSASIHAHRGANGASAAALAAAPHGDHLEFTNYTPGFSGCIEYIWHSAPTLRCRRLLGNVDFNYLQKVPGFPNFHFPSDHIPLFAEFAVEPPRKERKAVEADFGS